MCSREIVLILKFIINNIINILVIVNEVKNKIEKILVGLSLKSVFVFLVGLVGIVN